MVAVKLDVGVFAYNEEDCIEQFMSDLSRQSVFEQSDVDMHVLILANGCTDRTAARAQQALPAALAGRIKVLDLKQGGKSRTCHAFIHELSRPDAQLLCFMDADIRLPQAGTLAAMTDQLIARPALQAVTSRPVKDVVHDNLPVTGVARVIVMGGDGLTDFRKSICGQLYMLRAGSARMIGLPAGLPVEDGFIRAMVLTDLLSAPEDLSRIDGDSEIFHVYQSIRSLGELLRHQTRIIVGSAVNAALFRHIRENTQTQSAAHDLLMEAAEDPDWLEQVLAQELPRTPYGYVPFDFLTKRVRKTTGRRGLRGLAVLTLGVGLDAVVYILASWRMLRRQGAGHW